MAVQYETYPGRGKYIGRLWQCASPFHMGEGRYHFCEDHRAWRQVMGRPVRDEEFTVVLAEFKRLQMENLHETVASFSRKGYFLHEYMPGYFQIRHKPM